jgi:uncharacterized protein HemY
MRTFLLVLVVLAMAVAAGLSFVVQAGAQSGQLPAPVTGARYRP